MFDVLVRCPHWPDSLYIENIDEIHISDRLKRIVLSDHIHPNFTITLCTGLSLSFAEVDDLEK